MLKRSILAIVCVFFAFSALDFLIHGIILKPLYEQSAQLWRPMEQAKMGLLYVVTAISAIVFVTIYARLVSPKSLSRGLCFGFLFGLTAGVSMGYGTYAFQPIPYHLALGWFLGTLVEATVAGVIVGAIVKDCRKPSETIPAPTA